MPLNKKNKSNKTIVSDSDGMPLRETWARGYCGSALSEDHIAYTSKST